MKRLVNTGIQGLDDLLGGGIPEGSIVVLSGPPGVGKSTMAMQYIHEGLQKGESGVFLTIENTKEDIIEYAEGFNWDYTRHEKENRLEIIDRSIFEATEMQLSRDYGSLKEAMDKVRPKRVAVDSVTLFDFMFRDDVSRKMNMMHFVDFMKNYGCTTVMTLKQTEGFPNLKYDEWHFLSDGLVFLFWNRNHAENERCLWTVKMRGKAIDTNIRPIKITEKGVVVYTNDTPTISNHQ